MEHVFDTMIGPRGYNPALLGTLSHRSSPTPATDLAFELYRKLDSRQQVRNESAAPRQEARLIWPVFDR